MNKELDIVLKTLKQGFDFLMSPDLQAHLVPLKVACLVFFLGFLATVIILLFKSEYLSWTWLDFMYNFFKSPKLTSDTKIIKRWQKIKDGADDDSPTKRRLALIDAHIILENALKRMGHTGDTVEERLTKLEKAQVSNIEELKQVEALARDLFLNPEKELTREGAKEIINTFGRAFVDLEIL